MGKHDPVVHAPWRRLPHFVRLVVYGYRAEPTGDLVFLVCDVNQPGHLVHLRYQASDERFDFDRTWFYPGGLVNVLPLYVSLLI
jgi:hypothetical protein